MRSIKKVSFLVLVIFGFLASGCELLFVGAGKSATIEDTGFLQNYNGLKKETDPNYPELPDLWYLAPDAKAKFAGYKKILVSDFTALTTHPNDLASIGGKEFKGIKKDLPDMIADTLEGSSAFPAIVRISEKIQPKDVDSIKKLPGDAILMGNIKELVNIGGLAASQVEIKIVDIKTGKEILQYIHRGISDPDKVGLVMTGPLSDLIKKAKSL